MGVEEKETLLREMYTATSKIHEAIGTINKLIDMVYKAPFESMTKREYCIPYENAIYALKKVLDNNEEISQVIQKQIETDLQYESVFKLVEQNKPQPK